MTDITPPPELVREWLDTLFDERGLGIDPHKLSTGLAARAAQWGADQELEACCHYFARDLRESLALELRAARRPKPPSLKEQALEGLTRLVSTGEFFSNQMKDLDTIRRALEALPE
jgi:hypothetical protein